MIKTFEKYNESVDDMIGKVYDGDDTYAIILYSNDYRYICLTVDKTNIFGVPLIDTMCILAYEPEELGSELYGSIEEFLLDNVIYIVPFIDVLDYYIEDEENSINNEHSYHNKITQKKMIDIKKELLNNKEILLMIEGEELGLI